MINIKLGTWRIIIDLKANRIMEEKLCRKDLKVKIRHFPKSCKTRRHL